jgi:hypothetical protein
MKKQLIREAIDQQARIHHALELVYALHLNSTYRWTAGQELLPLKDAIIEAAKAAQLHPKTIEDAWNALPGIGLRNETVYASARSIINLIERGSRYVPAFTRIIDTTNTQPRLVEEITNMVEEYFEFAPWKPADFLPRRK